MKRYQDEHLPPHSFDVRAPGAKDCGIPWRLIGVRLNGVEQGMCLAYNVEEGWIDRYIKEEAGEPWRHDAERVTGVVSVRWLEIRR